MPKVVDRQAIRRDLAARAVPLFRESGFHALGMRGLASALGVSKGTLYHYFPSKQALFDACFEVVMDLDVVPPPADASPGERAAALVALALAMEADFGGELRLMLDYVSGLSAEEVRSDASLGVALAGYREAVAGIVGEERADPALRQLLGVLIHRLFDGGSTGMDSLQAFCSTVE